MNISTLAKALPGWLDREHELLPALARLGVPKDELLVLQGDEQLLRILVEDADDEASRRELERVLSWHQAPSDSALTPTP